LSDRLGYAIGRLYKLQLLESLKGKADLASEISVYLSGANGHVFDSPQPFLKQKEAYIFFLAPLDEQEARRLKNMLVVTGNTDSPFEPSSAYTLVDYKAMELNSASPTVDEIRALASQKN